MVILYGLIDGRSGTTTLYKVKAHCDDKGTAALISGIVTPYDLVGNALADGAAERGAAQLEPTLAEKTAAGSAEETTTCE